VLGVDNTPSHPTSRSWEHTVAFSSLLQRRKGVRKDNINVDIALTKRVTQAIASTSGGQLHDLYDIREPLGQGTMGVVFKANRRVDGLEVAVKTLRSDDQEIVNAARNEFELLSTVQHPNIIRPLEFFTTATGAVLVLEFFEARTLLQVVRGAPERRLAESVAHQLTFQLVSAVHHLHAKQIVHRDIKAENVLVTHDCSDLKLLDFNCAKDTSNVEPLTMTGTFMYMPPEVMRGEASPAQGSDVWSTGLCLHLMLLGRLPFNVHDFRDRKVFASLVSQQITETLQSPWELSSACKHALDHALELDPFLRASAADLLSSQWLRRNRSRGTFR